MSIFNFKNIYRLPYDYNFLSPVISYEQLKQHYQGHLLVYYNVLEKLISEHQLESMTGDLRSLTRFTFGKQNLLSVFNNAGQIVNHIHFFANFTKQEIPSNILDNVKKKYNRSNLIEDSLSTVKKFGFGSSWLWLASDKNSEIRMFVTPNSFIPENLDFIDQILMCIDLWEHAYYMQFLNNRSEYLKQIIPKTNIYNFLK